MSDGDKAKTVRDLRAEALKRRTRLIADTRGEVLALLGIAQRRIRDRLLAQPSAAEQWQLQLLQGEIRQALKEFADQAGAKVASAASAAWEAGQALVDSPLHGDGIRIDAMVPLLDTRQLLAMRSFMTERIGDIGITAANRINTELGLVVIGAQGQMDAISKVAEILGETSRARAITIVRTELSRVYGTASQERLAQAAAVVPGLKKQWRRSGKVHSRLAHDLADGQVQDADKPFKLATGVALMFPHDPKAPAKETINCGCTSIPWKAEWEVAAPGRKRYTEQEMQSNPMKRDIQEGLDEGRPIRELLAGGKAA